MKKLLFLIPLVALNTISFAQKYCSKDHPIYNMDNLSSPKNVYRLGSDPEFPFLRNLSSSRQVLAAMKSRENSKKYPRQMKELNKMLVEIGFDNGVQDVTLSSISEYNVSPGTTGNMGDGHFSYSYVKLEGSRPYKAWRISSGSKCDVSFFSSCGNAFYPFGAENSGTYTGNKPCKDVEVNVNTDPKEVTIDETKHATKKTYIYYKKGCPCEDCGPGWSEAGYNKGILSRPLLVKKDEVVVPQTYKVTSGSTGHVIICAGKPTEVTTDLQVEKENEYTGYNPSDVKKEYIEVSRREYKRALRNKEMMKDLDQRPHLEECKTCE
jgi:hypothetical protein